MKNYLYLLFIVLAATPFAAAAKTPCKNCGVSDDNIIFMCEKHHITCSKCARKRDFGEEFHANLADSFAQSLGMGKISKSNMRCTHVSAFDEVCDAEIVKVIVDNRSPESIRRDKNRSKRKSSSSAVREESAGARRARAESDRMDRIIRSSVLWNADSKTTSKNYLYQIQRQDGGDLIAYVGENYKRMAIQKYWFKARAMDEFAPTIPSGSSGYLKINISDDQGHGYILTNVKMTYNNAKTMTIHLTELSGNRVRCQIWTGHWHKRGDEEVRIIFDRILNPYPGKGMAYTYSCENQ